MPASAAVARHLDGDSETGVHIALPGPAARPAVTPQQAFRTCRTGDAVCAPGTPTIALASITDTTTGVLGSDGAEKLTIVGRLAYVMMWSHVVCLPVGPVDLEPTRATPSCTVVNFVDARTGSVLFSYRDS